MKKIMICLGVDVDAVSGWLGSYGGQDSANDIQRGVFAGEVGVPRMLNLFARRDVPSTFFIPGHSIETFPREMAMVADAGCEIGAHGYSHENPNQMSYEQERDVLGKSIELIEQLCGSRPQGYVAPWWEFSQSTASLLLENGFSYDHSQNYNDFTPFYARVGDTWTNVDYTQPASQWMHPLRHGGEIDLVEFCGNWYVDDLPPMMFNKHAANSHGYVSPRDVEELWRDQFDWVYRELDYAVFPVTLHPDVSGRPQVLLMLERLIDYWTAHDGVEFVTFGEAAADFRSRYPLTSHSRPPVVGSPTNASAAPPLVVTR
ncbi:polysaccharide deacetylase family protein [Williamsia sp. SKLECPSW1]